MKKSILTQALLAATLLITNASLAQVWLPSTATSSQNAYRTGRVGINTAAPTGMLHIRQTQSSTVAGPGGVVPAPNDPDFRLERLVSQNINGGAPYTTYLWDFQTSNNLLFSTTVGTAAAVDVFALGSSEIKQYVNTYNLKDLLRTGVNTTTNNSYIAFNAKQNGSLSGSYVLGTSQANSGGAIIESAQDGVLRFITKSNATTGLGATSTNNTRMLIDGDGRVAIGAKTTVKNNEQNQPYKLFVGGGILSQEISVKLAEGTFPDYVFDEDYKLLPLSEVKQYIDDNKHLPNMPSAEEVETRDMNLKAIILKQQEKIEELTLYLLQQEQRINQLEAKSASNPKN